MQATSSTETTKIPEILTRGVAEVLPSAAGLAALMAQRPIRVYLGIDPTGSLLTLGHAVVLRKLQQFAQAGHQTILLIGNGTVKIGDPTGRDSTRPALTDADIEANFLTWKEQASKILDFSKIEIRKNGDWLDNLGLAEFIKLAAKTTVQQLLERDMFQERLRKQLPIHGHELLYPLLQGYDSVAMDVDLELGGTDQTFNMLMGRNLQKIYHDKEKWVLSTPIINGTDGRKMSKSYGNFIALTENPTDMYGKLMRVDDSMIIEYFMLLSDLPQAEIEVMAAAMQQGENPLTFKKQLALSITTWLHSPELAQSAQAHFEQTVQAGEAPADVPTVTLDTKEPVLLDVLSLCVPTETRSSLRRLCEQGGVELLPQGKKPLNPLEPFTIVPNQIIRIGKRRFFSLKVA